MRCVCVLYALDVCVHGRVCAHLRTFVCARPARCARVRGRADKRSVGFRPYFQVRAYRGALVFMVAALGPFSEPNEGTSVRQNHTAPAVMKTCTRSDS
jgi:hypothetical protein